MENQNPNDLDNSTDTNKRLAQDTIERQHAASKNKIIGIAFALILIAVLAYFFMGNSNNNVVREPETIMVQQTPVVETPAIQAPASAPATAVENTPATAPATTTENESANTPADTTTTTNTTTTTTNSADMLNQPASVGDFNRPTDNQVNPTPDASTNSMDTSNNQGSVNGASSPAQ